MLTDLLVWSIVLCMSILPPLIFVCIRQSVKLNRQEIVLDLAKVFKSQNADTSNVIPSFEFVKYKYFLGRNEGRDDGRPRDYTLFSWIAGAIPLVLLLGFISMLSVHVVGPIVATFLTCGALAIPAWPLWAWSLCAAFAGAYVFMIRAFYRAINNFDLSPASFVGAASNLIVGIVGAQVLSHVLFIPVAQTPLSPTMIVVGTVILSFAIGYLPESATRTILWRSELFNFKRENLDVYKSSLSVPIEIIDGIDTEIRDRLGDFHIKTPQNLAAANPLMLFVETPYGVYQIMDWVAQAQLCCSVGPEAVTKFWKLGIRTLFDLERAAYDRDCYSKFYLLEIGSILETSSIRGGSGPTSAPRSGWDEETIVSNIAIRLDDPHVHRLRQIYILIGDLLGKSNRRFQDRDTRRQAGDDSWSPTI